MPETETQTTVVVATTEDEASLADADGPIVAVGIPVLDTADGPVLAPGVPAALSLPAAGGARVEVAIGLDPALCRQRGFSGREGQTLNVLGQPSGVPAVLYLGCGAPEKAGADSLRAAAAALVRGAGRAGTGVVLLPGAFAEEVVGGAAAAAHQRAAQATAEGAVLAGYRFVAHKSEDDGGRIERVVVLGAGIDEEVLAEGVRRGLVVGGATCLARDLVNEPPSTMTPILLAEAALEHLSGRPGVTMEVWDEDRIAAERLGGLLGVARGSAEPPRLVRATYVPPNPVEVDGVVPHVVLVGKGITFDSGGLSLKSGEGMMTMKTDMSGAAAVLATLSACGELGVRVQVTAIAPITENMPGGRAIKPGDVLTIRNGLTIEVLNTDAEGRLVLADALSLASELEPDAIIDLATLTGACVVALGNSVAGLFGSDESLVTDVREASARAGEATWPLPLYADYRSQIDSDVADMKNIGKPGQAGAITAALLLERFVTGTAWVHLDVAGPARTDEDKGVLTKGATGYGVRTLLELLGSFATET